MRIRHSPDDLVEELRLSAELDAAEFDDVEFLSAGELIQSDAADYIEYLWGFLRRIADGEPGAAEIATEALDHQKWRFNP